MSARPAELLDFISVSLVERLTSSTGLAFIVRARLRGAELRPAAIVHKRAGRLVAEIFYEKPVGPEQDNSLVVPLFLPLSEVVQ